MSDLAKEESIDTAILEHIQRASISAEEQITPISRRRAATLQH